MKSRLYLAICAVVCLAACGTPGAPRPPSLRLPRAAGDLAASRQGSTVTLTWTEPQLTTDGETIRALGPTLVCMGVNDFPMTHCDQAVADLSQAQFASCAPKVGQPVTCAVTLPVDVQQQNPLGQATYAVEVLNTNGRSAGLSNQVRVPTVRTYKALSAVEATVTAAGVEIHFEGNSMLVKSAYHVYRRQQNADTFLDLGVARPESPFMVASRMPFEFVDRSFEWEKTYEYRVAAISTVTIDGKTEQVEGDPTPAVTVFTKDIFAPATPTGLQAVASGVGQPPFIDLSWAPNTERDLAGYNVYRHEEGQAPVKINAELVKAPAYRDERVQRGHAYFYTVSGVDLRGNESAKSGEAGEMVQ